MHVQSSTYVCPFRQFSTAVGWQQFERASFWHSTLLWVGGRLEVQNT